MTIRFATPDDLPEILTVLKLSLGDPYNRRNPEFWNWKHSENPFGPSPVMLAFVNGSLAGVRAMMAWEFQIDARAVRAWRAVDTATAPGFQRTGIFSKLTAEMLSHLKSLGPSVIFNTPNPISAKGYFQLGWQPAGHAATLLKPEYWNIITNRFGNKQKPEFSKFQEPTVGCLDSYHALFQNQLHTNWNPDRLQWRYKQVPGLNYQTLSTPNGYLVFRLVSRGLLTELRLVEIFPLNTGFKTDINQLITVHRPDVVTALADGLGVLREFLPSGFRNIRRWSPRIIAHSLQNNDLIKKFEDENHRYFSAGTLELF